MSDHLNAARLSASDFASLIGRRRLLQLGAVGLGTVVISACNNGTQTGAGNTGGTPKKGGVLNFALSDASAGEKLDPALSIATNDAVLCHTIFEALCDVDDDFNLTPRLATAWKANADATEWTFTLRPGVKWHDGSPFTAEDVVFTARRWVDKPLGSPMYGQLSNFLDAKGVTAQGADTVVFKLKAPNSLLPIIVSAHNAKITKSGVTEFTTSTAVGTGPFKVKSWTPTTKWSVVRNESYWQAGLPYLDGINAVIIPNQGTKVQAVLSGSSDVCDTIPVSLWGNVQGRNNVTLTKLNNKQCWTFAFDQRKAPFNDERVLQALKLATDRDTILKTAFLGNGTVTTDVATYPGSKFYPADRKAEFDPAKAKSLLAEAGYPNGIQIELSTSGSIPGMLDIAQAWQQVVKPAGIEVTLKQFPETTYWSKGWMQTPAFQDFWNHGHPMGALAGFYQPNGPWDEAQHQDDELDKLIADVYATVDPEKQTEAIQKALARGAETFSYVIPVWVPTGWAMSKRVHDAKLDPENYIDFLKAWLA